MLLTLKLRQLRLITMDTAAMLQDMDMEDMVTVDMVVDMVTVVPATVAMVDYTMVKNTEIITVNTTDTPMNALRRRLMLHSVPSTKTLKLPKLNAS
jgi:hypothetical protein